MRQVRVHVRIKCQLEMPRPLDHGRIPHLDFHYSRLISDTRVIALFIQLSHAHVRTHNGIRIWLTGTAKAMLLAEC